MPYSSFYACGNLADTVYRYRTKGASLPTTAVSAPASAIMKWRKQTAECCLLPSDGPPFYHPQQPPFLFGTDRAVPSFILTVWFRLPFPGSKRGWWGRKDERRWHFDSSFFTVMSKTALSSLRLCSPWPFLYRATRRKEIVSSALPSGTD